LEISKEVIRKKFKSVYLHPFPSSLLSFVNLSTKGLAVYRKSF
jgi:hypothetical protein